MSTPFKMKGWSAFTKKTWPPGSEPFDVEKDVIEKKSGKVEKYTEGKTKDIMKKLGKAAGYAGAEVALGSLPSKHIKKLKEFEKKEKKIEESAEKHTRTIQSKLLNK